MEKGRERGRKKGRERRRKKERERRRKKGRERGMGRSVGGVSEEGKVKGRL